MVKFSTGAQAQKLGVLSVFIILLISLSSSDLKQFKTDKKPIWAGHTEPTPDTEYNLSGLPVNRLWLTGREWKGKHIKNLITKGRFKAWKKIHIETFIKFFTQAARAEAKVYKDIPPALYVAQAILESNFGLSRLAVTGNNLYGHKYHGKTDNFLVVNDDSPTDKFESGFKSQWHSIRSHSKLLMNRYRKRIKGTPTLDKWLSALCGGKNVAQSKRWRKKGGTVYATSCLCGTGYGQKLKRIIKCYNLDKI